MLKHIVAAALLATLAHPAIAADRSSQALTLRADEVRSIVPDVRNRGFYLEDFDGQWFLVSFQTPCRSIEAGEPVGIATSQGFIERGDKFVSGDRQCVVDKLALSGGPAKPFARSALFAGNSAQGNKAATLALDSRSARTR